MLHLTFLMLILVTVVSFSLDLQLTHVLDPPASGADSYSLIFVDVYTVVMQGWAALSACDTCSDTFAGYSTLSSGVWLPYVNGYQLPRGMFLADGETPTFLSEYPYPTGWDGYCVMDINGTQYLAAKERADLWSLCPNTTASGRLDVVYEPLANNTHYTLADCASVMLQLESS
ncbi:hypothetical protein FISHEDRAFT_59216 [Fistulina hepatica ATCC 64428]|uniref:Secreted protein n=1 Tax=Fistulina hepatica ATCC 64428 TaxID=1128425 RepID=A0A0D7AB87_9AGAR|nr:hypothetical protein FISHEDRAFT_59216 [Fistulina hepatica ATCC 64428]